MPKQDKVGYAKIPVFVWAAPLHRQGPIHKSKGTMLSYLKKNLILSHSLVFVNRKYDQQGFQKQIWDRMIYK